MSGAGPTGGDERVERSTVLDDVAAERVRQDEKWGEQNHPDGTGPDAMPLQGIQSDAVMSLRFVVAPWLADRAKNATDWAARAGHVTWRDVLLEEVFEALAEDHPTRLRTELVQVAAVAAQWVEAIDRRTAQHDGPVVTERWRAAPGAAVHPPGARRDRMTHITPATSRRPGRHDKD